MSKFWAPPIIRNDAKNSSEHRHVTWLELFTDLAFVVAISVIGHDLAKDLSPQGLITFTAYFVPIWWVWLGDAYYNNRYDPEDHGHQMLAILQIFGVLAVAIFAHQGLEVGYVGFALSYSILRFILLVLSYRIGKHNPMSRRVNYFTAKSIAIVIALWILSIFLDPPMRFAVMGLAIFIDLLSPILIANKQRDEAVNAAHISQRFGFFVIIMLGEILVAVVRSINDAGASVEHMALAGLSIALAFCFWWIYFENDYGPQVINKIFQASDRMKNRNIAAAFVWTYSHLPLAMGLMAVAVAIEKINHLKDGVLLPATHVSLLSLGMIAAIISIGIMQIAAMQKEEKFKGLEHFKLVLPFVTVILILFMTRLKQGEEPIWLLGGLVGIGLLQVALQEVIEHRMQHEH